MGSTAVFIVIAVPQLLVDPELAPLLDLFPTVQFSSELLPMIRSREFPLPSDPRVAELVGMTACIVAGPLDSSGVTVRVYAPRNREPILPCILHLHGGGFVTGSAGMMDPMHRALSLEENCAGCGTRLCRGINVRCAGTGGRSGRFATHLHSRGRARSIS